MSYNALSQTIPNEIGELTNLQFLYVEMFLFFLEWQKLTESQEWDTFISPQFWIP